MVKITDSGSFDYQGKMMDENLPHYKELLVLELTRKSSDLNHRQKLQQLLIESLNENDLNKAFLINTFLYPNQGLSNLNLLNSSQKLAENQSTSSDLRETEMDSANQKNINSSTEILINNTDRSESEISNENKTYENPAAIKIDKNLKPKLRGSPLSPIRHLICSPGLEEKADKHKIVVLYRGSCNGSCNPKKAWSKQSHFHYIINTINCNDHVSRLVKKQGLQFFNSSVLQNSERWNHLIKLYKMDKI